MFNTVYPGDKLGTGGPEVGLRAWLSGLVLHGAIGELRMCAEVMRMGYMLPIRYWKRVLPIRYTESKLRGKVLQSTP